MYTDLTELSRAAYDMATDEMLTIDGAISFLEKQNQMRTLYSKIMKFSKGRDEKTVKKLLIDGLTRHHPELDREAHRKRVEGWLNPKNTKSMRSKQDAIETAFLLGLTLGEADEFVTEVTGEKLHYRNIKEIVYIYGLQNGLNYTETSALAERMEKYLAGAAEKNPELLKDTDQTKAIRPRVASLHTEKELQDFLEREIGHLGYLHNTAYTYFKDFMDKLKHPVDEKSAKTNWSDEEENANEKLFVRDIVREYMLSDIVPLAKNLPRDDDFAVFTVKKEILKNWPEEAGLSRMKNRIYEKGRRKKTKEKKKNEDKNSGDTSAQDKNAADQKTAEGSAERTIKWYDVSRKVLILLYLATYSFDEDVDFDELDEDVDFDEPDFEEEELTRDEVFETICRGINTMLLECGFSSLDPRSPFDWIILYSICAEDLLDMDDRMKSLLMQMFPDPEKAPKK